MTAVEEIIAFCGDSKPLKKVKEFAKSKLLKEENKFDEAYDKGFLDGFLDCEKIFKRGKS